MRSDEAPTLAIWCAMLVIAAVAPMAGLFWPRLNWDMLAYIGIVQSWAGHSPADVLTATFADAHRYAATHGLERFYAELVNPQNEYRLAVSTDPQAFQNQLPFYRIRPLYLALLWLVAHATATMTAATVWISAASVFLTNVLVGSFSLRSLGARWGLAAAGVFALSPVMFDVAQMSTPDALSSLLVCAGLLALVSRHMLVGAVLLLLAALTRSDQIVMNALLALATLAATLREPKRPVLAMSVLLASVVIAKAVERMVGGYSYEILYKISFIAGFKANPLDVLSATVGMGKVISTFVLYLIGGFRNASLWQLLLVFGASGLVCLRRGWMRDETMLSLGILATLLVRVALFPSPDLRLVAPVLAGQFIVLVAALRNRLFEGSASVPFGEELRAQR